MFSDNLKQAREAMGITREQLAYILKTDVSDVKKWERGRALPDADMLIRVARTLGTSVTKLLGADVGVPEENTEQYKEALTKYLAYLNIQIELQNRRRRRFQIAIVVAAILLLFFVVMASCKANPVARSTGIAGPM